MAADCGPDKARSTRRWKMSSRIFVSARRVVLAAAAMLIAGALSHPASAISLSYQSVDTPSFAVFNGRLFMAYSGTDSSHHLNYAVSSDGLTYTQVSDGNRSGTGPAIAAWNGQMYSVWTGTSDKRINIASSTDGQHFSGQHLLSTWTSPWRPSLAGASDGLYLSWIESSVLYIARSTDGVNFSITQSYPVIPASPGYGATYMIYPATLATNSAGTLGWVATQSRGVFNAPNYLYLVGTGFTSCRSSPTGGGIQGGIGYLPGETLLAWRSGSTIYVDVNGGDCTAGGITYGSYGSTGVAPAVVGFNGHAYLAWTGTDSAQHINVVQVF